VRPRFHLPCVGSDGRGELDEEESAHLTRVLRLGPGAEIDVFDGRGGMFRARVAAIGRRAVHVTIEGPVPPAPEPTVQVTLVMSVLKGDKMDDVVRDAVMMGVSVVQPVVAVRTAVSAAALARGRRTERWQRIAVASVKQCGRAVVPPVRPPLELPTWLAGARTEPAIVLREPSSGPAAPMHAVARAGAVNLVIGPEGGWTDEECAAFEAAGARAVSLGGRTLRADAAPLVALAALYEAWSGW